MPRCQISERPAPDSGPHQPQGWQPNRRRHPSHLTVAPLADRQPQPAGRNAPPFANRWSARPKLRWLDQLNPCRPRHPIPQRYSAPQPRQGCFPGLSLNLDKIGLFKLVARICNLVLQRPIIGQDDQPLTVIIEPTRGIYSRPIDIIPERRPSIFIRKLTQNLERFIEEDDGQAVPSLPFTPSRGARSD